DPAPPAAPGCSRRLAGEKETRMQSQYDATISSDDDAVVAIAQLVYDAYATQANDYAAGQAAQDEYAAPAPALEDIIDSCATQHGFMCDDRALEQAVRDQFARHGEEMPSLAV